MKNTAANAKSAKTRRSYVSPSPLPEITGQLKNQIFFFFFFFFSLSLVPQLASFKSEHTCQHQEAVIHIPHTKKTLSRRKPSNKRTENRATRRAATTKKTQKRNELKITLSIRSHRNRDLLHFPPVPGPLSLHKKDTTKTHQYHQIQTVFSQTATNKYITAITH
jgi:hypothetical protein